MDSSFEKVMQLIKHLRKECPWDKKQPIHTFVKGVHNEAEELLRASDNNDASALRDEVADVLWDALFVTAIAEEKGLFTLKDVLDHQHEKMVRRHPHVFEKRKLTPEDVEIVWQLIKKTEREEKIKNQKAVTPIDPTIPLKTKAVIFDWDGVVADSFEFVKKTYKQLEKELNIMLIKDWKNPGLFLEVDWKKSYLKHGYTKDDIEKAEALFKKEQKNHPLELFSPMRALIPTLAQHFKLAIVSNNYTDWIKAKLKDEGLLRYFDEVIGVDKMLAMKPDPAALIMCLQLLGVKPQDAFYVGDMDGDIIAGKAAGVKTIAVTYGYHPRERLEKTKPHQTVASPEQLLEAIHQLH